jgi:hypothetical protein
MHVGHVQGGTNAGWKTQKPAPKPWMHVCSVKPGQGGIRLPAYWSKCPDCKTARPS